MLTVDGDPLVEVLPLRQHDGEAQVAGAQRGRRVPHQVVLVRAFGDVLLRLKCLVGTTPTVTRCDMLRFTKFNINDPQSEVSIEFNQQVNRL